MRRPAAHTSATGRTGPAPPAQLITGALTPLERASEMLFGLIMALTITGALSVAHATERDTRALFVSTLACNVAWGLVDAVMHVLNAVFERGRSSLVARALGGASRPEHARALLEDLLPAGLAPTLTAPEVELLRARVAGLGEQGAQRVRAADLQGAFGVFFWVVASTLPVALPFLLMHDTAWAMATSRGLALLLLFGSGYAVGRYAGLRPIGMGLSVLGVGVVLVAVVMALGG